MKRILWFQHFIITLLVGINAFVFMSMRSISVGDNLLFTAGIVVVSISVFSLLNYVRRSRRKKSLPNSF